MEVLDPAGGEPRLLTSNAADGAEAFYSTWSPDGALLYYLAKGAAGWMIRVVARGGGPSRILVRFDDPTRQPTRYGRAEVLPDHGLARERRVGDGAGGSMSPITVGAADHHEIVTDEAQPGPG